MNELNVRRRGVVGRPCVRGVLCDPGPKQKERDIAGQKTMSGQGSACVAWVYEELPQYKRHMYEGGEWWAVRLCVECFAIPGLNKRKGT